MLSKFKVAIAQIASVAFDSKACVEKMNVWAGKAATEDAKLVVFPEAFVSGYPASLDWGGQSTAFRETAAEAEYLLYWKGAIEINNDGHPDIADIARRHNIKIVAGVIEREDSTLYCTSVTFDSDGTFLGKHRKLMPTVAERLVWGRGDGSTLPVFDTDIGKIGSIICWENYMPLLRTAMYAKGIQLYCAPTADDSERWQNSMRHIAFEGGCFVISACQFSCRSDFPPGYGSFPNEEPDTVLFDGGSCIVAPDGEYLTAPVTGREALLVAEINPSLILATKYKLDTVGHYSRPDVFRLNLDARQHNQIDELDS